MIRPGSPLDAARSCFLVCATHSQRRAAPLGRTAADSVGLPIRLGSCGLPTVTLSSPRVASRIRPGIHPFSFSFPTMFNFLMGVFSNDIGIDLGTANTLVYVRDQGIVLREPSVVAVKAGTNMVLAVGNEAKRMLGRTPSNIVAVRPLKDGVIADFEITEAMLRHFITKVHSRRKMVRPRVWSSRCQAASRKWKSAPSRRAPPTPGRARCTSSRNRWPRPSAWGCRCRTPRGNMIIDIGGGTTEVALISLSGIVFSRSVRVAGDELDEAIVNYVKRAYNLMIGERTAEEIKIKIGSAFPPDQKRRRKRPWRSRGATWWPACPRR